MKHPITQMTLHKHIHGINYFSESTKIICSAALVTGRLGTKAIIVQCIFSQEIDSGKHTVVQHMRSEAQFL